MYLVAQGRYEEAKIAIKHMFNKEDDPDKIFNYFFKNTSRETDRATILQSIFDKRYRKTTFIVFSFSIINFFNGIYPINT